VFFAYIGFDAISTTAEECRAPERDLPRGILWSLLISTSLYVVIALVLTGVVKYDQLGVGDPLALVFNTVGRKWLASVIAFSAVVAMTSVLLVFQLGQPRIWLAMSRDGLLPRCFARIHPRFHTPSYATIVTAVAVIVPALFIPTKEILNLCSMGTLLAFVLVCGGVLRLQNDPQRPKGKFRTPYVNSRYFLPVVLVGLIVLAAVYGREWLGHLVTFQGWSTDKDKIPMYLFAVFCLSVVPVAMRWNLSLLPTLGLLFSAFMMAQIPLSSWLGFGLWMLLGLAIYFCFGVRHSAMAAR
jgi:amino acid transporter